MVIWRMFLYKLKQQELWHVSEAKRKPEGQGAAVSHYVRAASRVLSFSEWTNVERGTKHGHDGGSRRRRTRIDIHNLILSNVQKTQNLLNPTDNCNVP